MAGYRHSNARRIADRTGRRVDEVRQPKRVDLRAQRRLARLDARLRAAKLPGDRVGRAADYVRAVLKDVPPATAERAANDVVELLIQYGQRLAATTGEQKGTGR